MTQRGEKFCRMLAEKGMDAAWVSRPENVRYLTGYTGEGALLVLDGDMTILTDFRYVEQAAIQAPGCACARTSREDNLYAVLSRLVARRKIARLGCEMDVLTVSAFEAARAAMPGVEFAAVDGLVESLRAIKDAGEIECIKRAARIACTAFENLLGWVRPGMTERQIQRRLDYDMLELGSEQSAFSTIACAGPNGSLPHAVPSDRPVQNGELLTLDFGAQVNGYKCDMTRTIGFGKLSDKLVKIYDTVLQAQSVALAAIRPGASCREVDRVARELIDARYPGAFGHSLGHSVGLFIHETPSFSTTSADTLRAGHVMTVEPGVYIAGFAGCRIEDMAIITGDGYVNPITAPKNLIIV